MCEITGVVNSDLAMNIELRELIPDVGLDLWTEI